MVVYILLRVVHIALAAVWFGAPLGFLVVWLLGLMAVVSMLGGTICRMSALHAAKDERISVLGALKFAWTKWIWFFLSPLIPLIIILLIWVGMALVGLVFNLPVLDVFGSVIFALALFGGFVVALLLIGLLGGANLLYPAIAVEGSEAFDALSRAFHYVFFRPWRLIFYSGVSLIYGAITYLFVGLVIFLTLAVTQKFAGTWVFREVGDLNRFQAIIPPPQIGKLSHDIDWSNLGPSGTITAAFIKMWVFLLVAMLGAYAVTFYFGAHTWIYLLLRRAADGTEYDDVYVEPSREDETADSAASTPEKVEPAADDQSAEAEAETDSESSGE